MLEDVAPMPAVFHAPFQLRLCQIPRLPALAHLLNTAKPRVFPARSLPCSDGDDPQPDCRHCCLFPEARRASLRHAVQPPRLWHLAHPGDVLGAAGQHHALHRGGGRGHDHGDGGAAVGQLERAHRHVPVPGGERQRCSPAPPAASRQAFALCSAAGLVSPFGLAPGPPAAY